jgi:hypothetical protein
MADQPLDPLKVMQAFLAGWNHDKGATAHESRPADPLAGGSSPAEGLAMRLLAQALAATKMPGHEENATLAGRLDRIEGLLSTIVNRLDHLEAGGANSPPADKKRKKKR